MTAEERSAGLAAAARVQREALLALADRALQGTAVELLEAPEPGTIMLELESRAGTFCFTEVAITTARVQLDGTEGWGCVMGFDREAAVASAVCDARPSDAVTRLAAEALEAERQAREAQARGVARTRV
ncbi:MAG: phosphonate C-P lyase system protein PhnG [Vulcanimicrobiaceae bacterium]